MKFQLMILSFIVLGSIQLLFASGFRKTGSPQSLSERVELLTDLNAKRPVLKFNLQKFRDFVKAGPRNYSIVIMFTALAPARQCAICRHAHDEYVVLANSYRYSQANSNNLFFATIDFDEGSDVFQLLRLNTAPVFMHFPAKGKPKAADTLDIQRSGYMAEALSKWIQERTDIQIRVFRPPNYTGTFAILTLGSLVVGVLYMRRNNLEFLFNKRMWGVLALTFCFAMISGQMWNHIRTPPLMHRGANGGIAYIHGSSQAQLIIETYIIMFLNAMIVLGMILLTESGQQSDQRKGRFMAIVGLVLVAIFFSLLLSVFRSKAQGYPYRSMERRILPE